MHIFTGILHAVLSLTKQSFLRNVSVYIHFVFFIKKIILKEILIYEFMPKKSYSTYYYKSKKKSYYIYIYYLIIKTFFLII